MRHTVYISGPITLGDPEHNFAQSCVVQHLLINAGFAPLNPMLTMKLPMNENFSHAVWMEVDIPWVAKADTVFRLPGESVGADEEVKYAEDHGSPVFYNLADIVQWKESV